MEYTTLQTEIKDRVLYLTINRPESLNALNINTMYELNDLFEKLEKRDDIGAVIITGAGKKAFVAGADISEFSSFNSEEGREMAANGHSTFNAIEGCSKPVVAAINGFALGGGCELAMSCHIRVASESARFGQPEVKLGIIPGYGGTQRLPYLIGKGRAMELLLTGDMIDANTALNYGLVNHVVPEDELIGKCEEIVRKIMKNGPLAASKIIDCVNAQYRRQLTVEDPYQYEIRQFSKCLETEDFKEGTAAFLGKRKANFKGN